MFISKDLCYEKVKLIVVPIILCSYKIFKK